YTGNIDNPEGGGTCCHRCGALLVGRHGYTLTHWALENGACGNCGEPCPGLFERRPGQWGQRRLPVRLRDFASLQ
ncbi:MAG TPA: AmmeMemoRadiSam system radical SAM enzyme, partial [Thermoanaerobaculia bacterium]|nr:AmmeMemoRadiSam system radical SAM enzyme [Thermoanaerobaculia bacterium]